jgi:predicted nucleic acid-binding Zn ribbon protein
MKSQNITNGQEDTDQIVEIAEAVFAEIFDKSMAVHAKPLFLKNRTLTVTCSSPDAAKEIRTNHRTIVDKINDKLGKKEIDRIRYLA